MEFHQSRAEYFIPDGQAVDAALARTTHLCIGAHPDDQEINAYHGIVSCYRQADTWFTGVCVSDGAGSSRTGVYEAYSDAEMIEVRRLEQRQAAVVGEYGCEIQLAWPSAQVKDASHDKVVDELEAILLATRPEVVYLHNPADKHDTHVACFFRSIKALRRLPVELRPRVVYGYEGWRNLDWLGDDEKVPLPVDAHPNLFAALVGIFDSQITGGKRYDLAAAGRSLSNATFFDSHAADDCSAVAWAVDLTPLVQDDDLCVQAFTLGLVDRFRADVQARLERLG